MNTDLFPETLLVSREGRHIYTTSLKVAEFFGRKYKNVLRAIEQILADLTDPPLARPVFTEDRGLRFEPTIRNVPGPKGAVRKERLYLLTHDDFLLLAMNFKSAQATRWKLVFITEFRRMEAELTARTTRFATALDHVRPFLRAVVEGTEAGYSRHEIADPLDKSVHAVPRQRRIARRLGLLAA